MGWAPAYELTSLFFLVPHPFCSVNDCLTICRSELRARLRETDPGKSDLACDMLIDSMLAQLQRTDSTLRSSEGVFESDTLKPLAELY